MFILSNLLQALASVLNVVLTLIYWLILIRALISWVNPDPYNPIVQFLYKGHRADLIPNKKDASSEFWDWYRYITDNRLSNTHFLKEFFGQDPLRYKSKVKIEIMES